MTVGIWKYFVLTLFIELPVLLIWLWPEWRQTLLIVFLLNLFTWSLLVWVYGSTKWNIILLECLVALIEGIGYRIFFRRNFFICILVAFLVNSLSYIGGLIIF